jgi:hypothetical protein
MTRTIPIFILASAAFRPAVAQRESSSTFLVGEASFPQVLPTEPERGVVRFILRGTGDISDNCPDALRRSFTAELDGEIIVNPDASFEAHLFPLNPPVITPGGCPITSFRIQQFDEIMIAVNLPNMGLDGRGWLNFQNLSNIDADELERGEFGRLDATIVFKKEGVSWQPWMPW